MDHGAYDDVPYVDGHKPPPWKGGECKRCLSLREREDGDPAGTPSLLRCQRKGRRMTFCWNCRSIFCGRCRLNERWHRCTVSLRSRSRSPRPRTPTPTSAPGRGSRQPPPIHSSEDRWLGRPAAWPGALEGSLGRVASLEEVQAFSIGYQAAVDKRDTNKRKRDER